jgi:hypothetical protein
MPRFLVATLTRSLKIALQFMVDAAKASLGMDVIQDALSSETLFHRRQKQTTEAITGLKDFDVI